MIQYLGVAPKLVDPFLCIKKHFSIFLSFLILSRKDVKTLKKIKKDNFDQQAACETLIRWSKYTTGRAELYTETFAKKGEVLNNVLVV